MKRQKTTKLFARLCSLKHFALILIALISLAGCQAIATPQDEFVENETDAPVMSNAVATNQSSPASPIAGGGVLQTCLRELEALKRVHQKRYQAKSGDLNRVLTQAKSYMELRESLNGDTVAIMDAAYQFKISRTCNSVRTELTRTLLERLESL
ncbi:hypothetical protein [Thorsellia anophelis]|nr:hypothetical protein [Thorsellia anophelis]